MTVTPGVKGTLSVTAKPFLDEEFVVGPFWLNAAKVKLGTIHLHHHDGTEDETTVIPGTKSYSNPTHVGHR